MKKIVLTMFAVLFSVTLSCAESCKDSPVKVEYRADEGNCNYQTRTCCPDGTWSGWDEGCGGKQECKDGAVQYAFYVLPEMTGVKHCQRTCKDKKWGKSEDTLECKKDGFRPVNDESGLACVKREEINIITSSKKSEKKADDYGNKYGKLSASYKVGDRCKESERGYYRYVDSPDAYNAHFYVCVKEDYYFLGAIGKVIGMGETYYEVEEYSEPAQWNRTNPSGCKFSSTASYFGSYPEKGGCNEVNEGYCYVVDGTSSIANSKYEGYDVGRYGEVDGGRVVLWHKCELKRVNANNPCNSWSDKDEWSEVEGNIPFN